jgi:hypothetical protein
MSIKTLFTAGIIGVAIVAGVFEALNTPRKKEPEKKKEEGEKS